jgi:hypothetical protein
MRKDWELPKLLLVWWVPRPTISYMPGRVNFDRGTQMAGIIKDESRHDPSRGFACGYEMETLPGFGLAGVASNTIQGASGREYAKVIEMYDRFAGMWLVGEDMPQEGNAVTLHPTEKDKYGMPVPIVHFKDHANDIAMRNHAYKAGTAVYQSLGATQVFEYRHSPANTTWAPAARARTRRTASATSSARRTTFPISLSRMAVSSRPEAQRIRR